MSVVKTTICDRCGKTVDPNGDKLEGTFDLCAKCLADLREWIRRSPPG